jgi:UDP-N-acetylmuramyl pentapeptide phosphotransferase/UDP-N-acetylglucosamine-1-phosphate transferase
MSAILTSPDRLTLLAICLGLCLLSALAAMFATGAVLRRLKAQAILDHPNERSSHETPTPRGGGWGILAAVFPLWTMALGLSNLAVEAGWLMGGAAILATISWLDDLRTIPARQRLAVQVIAVLMGVLALGQSGPVLQGLVPLWLDRVLVALAWLWFLNLYNFMDGIDGLAGAETASIGFGVTALVIASPLLFSGWPAAAWMGAALAGASIGFLRYNWHPAKLFMGDVGSVPLGFLIGWLLFSLAGQGYLAAAIILPLYFCTDASITLLRRLLRGQKPWEAHREHFYQRSIQNGRSHALTTLMIVAGNLALIGCALLSLWIGWLALIPAAIVTALLLLLLARPAAGPVSGLS